jgi:hypothetical protein
LASNTAIFLHGLYQRLTLKDAEVRTQGTSRKKALKLPISINKLLSPRKTPNTILFQQIAKKPALGL